MVPFLSLEASTLTFVCHAWGQWRAIVGAEVKRPKASRKELFRKCPDSFLSGSLRDSSSLEITHSAWVSCRVVLAIEIPFCLSSPSWASNALPTISLNLPPWQQQHDVCGRHQVFSSLLPLSTFNIYTQTIDWCYIFYTINAQIASVLPATTPRCYFFQALGFNLWWMLPSGIAVTRVIPTENAWIYYSVDFGGSFVFSFFNVTIAMGVWAWLLMRGRVRLVPVRASF
jgi:hypothetical protein